MCFGGGGGGGRASLSQIRQGRGMAVQRSGTSEYTDYDYSGVTAYQSANNNKKFKAVSGLDGASVAKVNPVTGKQKTKYKFASVSIGSASEYNAAIDAGAKFTSSPVEVKKQAELGRTAVMDETGARIKTRAARSQVANANDASVASKKTKKRGGLRIDRSSSVAGGGSGVNIPS